VSRIARWFTANAYPLAVAAAAFIVASGLRSADSDAYWHLATARWTVEHGRLLHADVFSSTVAGHPYGIGEWLGELVLYGAYTSGGWAGIAVLRGLLVALAAFFIVRVARRSGAPWIVTLPLVVAGLAIASITWTDRPQLWTFALFPLLLELLLAVRAGRYRLLLLIPPLFLLWTNLHGGFVIGLALLGIFAIESVLRRRIRLAALIAGALVIAAAVTLLDPAPFDAGTTAREDAIAPPRFITEFLPPDVLTPPGALFALFIIGAMAAALLRGGDLLDAGLLLPLLWLGLSAQRHMPFFVIAATPFIARSFAGTMRRYAPAAAPPGVAAALAAILLVAALAAVPFAPSRPNDAAYPAAAADALRAGSGVLLNEFDWGGWLIWNVPERPVFVDGRYVPYLGGVLDDFREAIRLGPRWHDVLARYDVREVLLRPDRPLVVALREDGWRVRASGPSFVLLAKP
jgi:hypothetical protein